MPKMKFFYRSQSVGMSHNRMKSITDLIETNIMPTVLFDEAQQNLATLGEQTCQDHEPCLVKRENNQHVVILALEDYNAWVETHYLLSNPANAK